MFQEATEILSFCKTKFPEHSTLSRVTVFFFSEQTKKKVTCICITGVSEPGLTLECFICHMRWVTIVTLELNWTHLKAFLVLIDAFNKPLKWLQVVTQKLDAIILNSCKWPSQGSVQTFDLVAYGRIDSKVEKQDWWSHLREACANFCAGST